jgi:hypothetical protein
MSICFNRLLLIIQNPGSDWLMPGEQGCIKKLLQKQNPGVLPGAFTLIPTFSQIQNHGLRRRSKNQGFSSPVFMFLKTGEVQEWGDTEASQQPFSAPGEKNVFAGVQIIFP